MKWIYQQNSAMNIQFERHDISLQNLLNKIIFTEFGMAGAGIGIYLIVPGDRLASFSGKLWREAACRAQIPILKRRYQQADDTGAYFIHPRYYSGTVDSVSKKCLSVLQEWIAGN
jgi:hypothetical protein